MFKDKLSSIMAHVAMLLALESYEPNKPVESIKEKPIEIKVDEVENHEIAMPDISGPVENLPWQYDKEF